MDKIEKARKEFEKVLKEFGVDEEKFYDAMEKRQEKFNFQDEKEANGKKAEVIEALKEVKKSILYAGDGHVIVYGSPVTVLSSLCCLINNLKEDVPVEILKDSINLVLGDE